MKKINITITGALGKMGKILIHEIKENKKLNLYSLIDIKNKKYIGLDVKKINPESFYKTDVIIDFSRPEGCMEVLKYALKFNKKLIIGTTGFKEKQEKLIIKASKKIAIFKSGNMSPGINMLEYLIKIAAKKIPKNYNIGIFDNHHKNKIDYPSGTALMLAKVLATSKNKKLNSIYGRCFLNKSGFFNKNKINFFITRKGKTVGVHSVQFNNNIEKIEIKHEAFSRKLFAQGALDASMWLNKKNKGLYNMQDIYNLK